MLLLVLLLLGLQTFLIPDELFLHEEVVLYPLHLEEPEPALGVGCDPRKLVGGVRSLDLLPLLADPGGDGRLILLLLLLLALILAAASCAGLLVSHIVKILSLRIY